MRGSAQAPRLPSHRKDLVPTSLLLSRRRAGAWEPGAPQRPLTHLPDVPVPATAGHHHRHPPSRAKSVHPAPLRVSGPRHAGHYEHLRCSDTTEVLWACVLATLLRTQAAPEGPAAVPPRKTLELLQQPGARDLLSGSSKWKGMETGERWRTVGNYWRQGTRAGLTGLLSALHVLDNLHCKKPEST